MDVFEQLAQLYEDIEDAYGKVATVLDFSCTACPDNCCDSYFLHHTYLEWLYLWQGFSQLSPETQSPILAKCRNYVKESDAAIARQEQPLIMCPLNDAGRCSLYSNRMLICRLHGVPTSMTLPNGQKKSFPGCFRCQEVTSANNSVVTMDRTKFFTKMVQLEHELLGHKRHILPRVKLSIAEMLIQGVPRL